MKRFLSLYTLFFVLTVLPPSVWAQQCLGTMTTASSSIAGRSGMGAATLTFVGNGNNCTGVPSGAATSCGQRTQNGTLNQIYAIWSNTTMRSMDSMGGCVFTCPGGSCKVDRVGLPVELMEFGVEEGDSEK